MINDELLNKFETIQELPVSEEMLGAYLEGKLAGADMDKMHMLVQNNPILQSIIEETAGDILEASTEFAPIDMDDHPAIESDGYEYLDADDLELLAYSEPEVYTEPDRYVTGLEIVQNHQDLELDNIIDDNSFELPEIPFF